MEQRRMSAERQFVGRRTLRKGANTPGVEDLSIFTCWNPS